MKKNVMIILIGNRIDAAEKVQKLLTAWGCLIKTRLGVHDGVLDDCSERGLLILELVGEEDKIAELERKLSLVKGVTSRLVSLAV